MAQESKQLSWKMDQTIKLSGEQTKAVFESIIFAAEKPVSVEQLCNITGISNSEAEDVLNKMCADYQQQCRGITLMKRDEGWQLVTKPSLACYVKLLFKPAERPGLSQAALETLAIIAYRQPITRNEIETIRGVKCESSLATLLERRLINEQGRLNTIGKPILYGTTNDFLSYFGISALEELPKLEDKITDISIENKK